MTKISPAVNHSFVELHVPDLAKAKNFYLKINFKLVWEIDTYAVLKFDSSIITLYQGPSQYFDTLPQKNLSGFRTEIVIIVESQKLADYYKFCQNNLQKLGGKIVEPLVLQDYGKWDFRIIDLFGFYLRFTEPENILYP